MLVSAEREVEKQTVSLKGPEGEREKRTDRERT
jgi:hypothetical protein